jgi:hypothetical protein
MESSHLRYFYDRPVGSRSTEAKGKKVYYLYCNQWWYSKMFDVKGHSCPVKNMKTLDDKSELALANKFIPSYQKTPTTLQALCVLVIDNDCAFSFANSEKVTECLKSAKAPKSNIIPIFNKKKVTDCIQSIGWENVELNEKYCAKVGIRAVTIDAVDIAGKHYTIAAAHNALQLRHFIEDNLGVKMKKC